MPISGGAALTAFNVWNYRAGFEELCEDQAVVTGGVGNWGAWVQMVAVSLADIFGLIISGPHENPNVDFMAVQAQVGIGAPAAEAAVAQSGLAGIDGNEDWAHGGLIHIPTYIPAGSRICIRTKNETQNNETANYNVVGVTQ